MAKRMYLKDASKALGITQWTLRIMAKSGEIPCWLTGNRYIFDIEQCEEFLKNKALANIKPVETKQYGMLRKINAD